MNLLPASWEKGIKARPGATYKLFLFPVQVVKKHFVIDSVLLIGLGQGFEDSRVPRKSKRDLRQAFLF